MVGVLWRVWEATLHPWFTDRDLELGCPWSTPLTLCPATTTMDHRGAIVSTTRDPHQRPMQASPAELTWMIATGTQLAEIHLYVGLTCLGFKPSRLGRHVMSSPIFPSQPPDRSIQMVTELWIQATEPIAGTSWTLMLLSHRYVQQSLHQLHCCFPF